MLGLALHQRLQRQLGAVPALVAVHRVIAAGHASHPAPRGLQRALQLGHIAGTGVRGGVAAVGERVHHHVGYSLLPRELEQVLQVLHARVHAAVRDQAEQVQPLGVLHRLDQDLALPEVCVADAAQILLDHGARAEVEVPNLRVAHLALREPDRFAAGGQLGVRMLLPQLVEDRRLGQVDRIARPRLGDSPAVQDDQADRGKVAHCAAAATIWAKPSGSRLAPPTRAPSTSG